LSLDVLRHCHMRPFRLEQALPSVLYYGCVVTL